MTHTSPPFSGGKGTLKLGFFQKMGMGLLELIFEVLVEFGLIQGFGFGEKINGDVCRALEIGLL